MIIYLHGFASHGEGNKAQLLRKYFPEQNILAPTLPVNPLVAIKYIEKVLHATNELVIFVGTSLGGFYAYYFAALHDCPAIIINPSLEPWKTLKSKVGKNKRYDTGEEFEWKEEYLDYLKSLNEKISKTIVNDYFLHFYISLDDEEIDHKDITNKFSHDHIKFYENMGHRFNDFSLLLPEIKRIIDEYDIGDGGTDPEAFN